MNNIIKNIIDVLVSNGFKAYMPGYHVGECTEPYTVVKKEGLSPVMSDISSERPIYTIMCYVPEREYSYLEQMIYEVKQYMKKLYPMLMYGGNETPSFYDEDVKGHMISIQYLGCRRIENF